MRIDLRQLFDIVGEVKTIDLSLDFSEEEYCDVAKVTDKDGKGLYIIWSYSEKVKNGCWCIGIQQLDEDIPIPDWARDINVTMSERGYSVVYELNVPDDVTVEWMVDE